MVSRVTGFPEFRRALAAVKKESGVKVLKSALKDAARPAVNAMRSRAPVGSKGHRTHRGRLVAPGFLKRSIRTVSTVDIGTASAIRSRARVSALIGVRAEAFYGVSFVEGGTKFQRPQPWFESSFESKQRQMTERFRKRLRLHVERAAKRGR